jgi:peptidoglycan/LPS O-acetylase OafA/YrhL
VVLTRSATRPTTFPYVMALDGLRGVLVFPVALYHFSLTSGADAIFARGSFFAPSVFFALSGFLITSLLLAEHERSGGLDWRGFWRRRFRRLIPASVVIVLGCAALGAVFPGIWSGLMPLSDAVAGLLSFKNWQSIAVADQHVYRLLGPLSPYWSLAVEEQFYLGLSIVVAISARSRNFTAWLVALLTGVGIFSIVSLIVHEDTLVREFFGTDTRASEIVAGCLMAVVVHHFGWPTHRWWPKVGWAALVVIVLAWTFVPEDAAWVLGGGLALISIVNIGLLGGAIVPGTFASFLRFRPLVELGKISYPVYLVHWPIGILVSPNRVGLTGWPLIGLRFAVTIAAGYAIFRFVERPMRHRGMLAGRSGLYAWAATAAVAVLLTGVAALRA